MKSLLQKIVAMASIGLLLTVIFPVSLIGSGLLSQENTTIETHQNMCSCSHGNSMSACMMDCCLPQDAAHHESAAESPDGQPGITCMCGTEFPELALHPYNHWLGETVVSMSTLFPEKAPVFLLKFERHSQDHSPEIFIPPKT